MSTISPNFHGKKGRSGRKSIKEEIKAYQDANALFFEEQDQEMLEAKIRTGKFRIADRYILTALEGDTKVLTSLSNKALPDVIRHEGEVTSKVILVDE